MTDTANRPDTSRLWTPEEMAACVRTYLWMRAAEQRGEKPIKSRVRKALLAGPLSNRSESSVEYRFQNISAFLQDRGEPWIIGYKPAKNLGTGTADVMSKLIDEYTTDRASRKISWLINSLPLESIANAAKEIIDGVDFDYHESTDYDVIVDGRAFPPKQLVAHASRCHYGAALRPDNFAGGAGTTAFLRLREAGFSLVKKIAEGETSPETERFRGLVEKRKKQAFGSLPEGNRNPAKRSVTTITFERDPNVVAFVELRAQGRCELCGNFAPFRRADGSPFLEVHHIASLASGGEDTVKNVAALCPNCHRACHHSQDAQSHQKTLRLKVASIASQS